MAKGIWIPIEVLHNKDLTMQEKLILMEISQLEMLDSGCIASNSHFAELLQISAKSASNTISGLVKKGYIKTQIKDGTRNHLREIFTIHPAMDTPPQIMDTPPQIMDKVSIKDGETKENKTINKTINKKNKQKKEIEQKQKIELPKELNVEAFSEWLNFKGKKYTSLSQKKAINLLIKYPFEIQQQMIDNSIMNSWQGLFEIKNANFQTKDDKYQEDMARISAVLKAKREGKF